MTVHVIPAAMVEADLNALLEAGGDAWDGVSSVQVELAPTPLERQPSAYVQTAWDGKERGNIANVEVKALRSNGAVAIQLTWRQPAPNRSINDYNVFADACAVLFPENGREAELGTMGSPDAPVVGWYWRAGTDEPFEVTAKGIGTVDRSKEHGVRSSARWTDDRWCVTLVRDIHLPRPALDSAAEIPIAFAVWAGAVGERAGLKSHSPEFHRLRLTQ